MGKSARKELVLTIAKALIAAAWADGEITLDERNSLKELLFHLRELSARDWASLEIYMAAPIDEEERKQLLASLQATIRSPADKELAIDALQRMIEVNNPQPGEFEQPVAEIIEAIENTHVDPVSQLSKAMRAPLRRRQESNSLSSKRELELEQFMRNRIAFRVQRQLEHEISDEQIQLWSAAGGLLARVAHADRLVTEEKRKAFAQAMQKHWDLEEQVIEVIIEASLDEISTSHDFYRLTRTFYQHSQVSERRGFVASLYLLALSDGELSHVEGEEIRNISRGLKLTHRQMIQAKLEAREPISKSASSN